MRSTIFNVIVYCFLVMLAVSTAHWALEYDAVAWFPAIAFAAIAAVTGFFCVYQELENIRLPKIDALDLRKQHHIPVPANDVEPPADGINLPFYRFPAGAMSSS